jgi:hypothetical protein
MIPWARWFGHMSTRPKFIIPSGATRSGSTKQSPTGKHAMQKNDGDVPRFDSKLPLKGALGVLTTQLESVKASVARMESDRYTASDARRDFAWRDERMVEQGKRITELEARRR